MFARVTTYELAEGRASESIDAFQPAIDQFGASRGSWTRTSWSSATVAMP